MEIGEYSAAVFAQELGTRIRIPVPPLVLAARTIPAIPERVETLLADVTRDLDVFPGEHAARPEGGRDVAGIAVVTFPGECHRLLRAAHVARTGPCAIGC